jgi:hypothetical protein
MWRCVPASSMGRRSSNAKRSLLGSASRTTAGGVTIRRSRPWWPLYARYPVRSCSPANGYNPPSLCQNSKVARATPKFRGLSPRRAKKRENSPSARPYGISRRAFAQPPRKLRRPRPRLRRPQYVDSRRRSRLKCTNSGHSPSACAWVKRPKTVSHSAFWAGRVAAYGIDQVSG